jgi:hypothetical protein
MCIISYKPSFIYTPFRAADGIKMYQKRKNKKRKKNPIPKLLELAMPYILEKKLPASYYTAFTYALFFIYKGQHFCGTDCIRKS